MDNKTILIGGGENKLLAYVDICGIKEFYRKKPLKDNEICQIANKIGYGFLDALQQEVAEKEHDRMSIHVLSDSALLVPHDNPKNNKPPMNKEDIVKLCLKLFESMVQRTQKIDSPNLSRILITRGTYFYIEYKNDERLNYTIGGNALVKCVEADKKEGLPFGVFTDCSDIKTIWPSHFRDWQFVDHRSYLSESEYKGFEYLLGERLLPEFIKRYFHGWDKTSIKLRQYCETLLGIFKKDGRN
jgi:hypothetical protein